MSDPVARLVRVAELADVDYAYASVVPAGTRLVHLAGSCPLDADGGTVAPGDVAAQATRCVTNLRAVLAAVDARVTDLVSTRVLVASADRGDLVTAWEAVRAELGDHDVPSTLMGVTALGYDGQLVEVEAVAALPEV